MIPYLIFLMLLSDFDYTCPREAYSGTFSAYQFHLTGMKKKD